MPGVSRESRFRKLTSIAQDRLKLQQHQAGRRVAEHPRFSSSGRRHVTRHLERYRFGPEGDLALDIFVDGWPAGTPA